MTEQDGAGLYQIFEFNDTPVNLMEPRSFFLYPVVETSSASGKPARILKNTINADLTAGNEADEPIPDGIGGDVMSCTTARRKYKNLQAPEPDFSGEGKETDNTIRSCSIPTRDKQIAGDLTDSVPYKELP